MTTSPLLTLTAAAALSGIAARTLKAACKSGRLPATKFGRAWAVTEAALWAWVRNPAAHKPGPKSNGATK